MSKKYCRGRQTASQDDLLPIRSKLRRTQPRQPVTCRASIRSNISFQRVTPAFGKPFASARPQIRLAQGRHQCRARGPRTTRRGEGIHRSQGNRLDTDAKRAQSPNHDGKSLGKRTGIKPAFVAFSGMAVPGAVRSTSTKPATDIARPVRVAALRMS